MGSKTRSQRIKTTAAFTLVELVLTVALLLLFAGAVILSLGPLDSQSRLEEGALQFETLFHYARAQSANTGRQVRIVFDSERPVAAGMASQTNLPPSVGSNNPWIQVLWEPDPVGAPGRFESLPGAEMLVEQVNDLVKVQVAGQPGSVASQAGSFGVSGSPLQFQAGDTNGLPVADVSTNSIPPLTCYPDGSSDSMEILLAAASGDDQRLALVTLSGLSGRARHRILAPTPDGLSPSADEVEGDLWPDQ